MESDDNTEECNNNKQKAHGFYSTFPHTLDVQASAEVGCKSQLQRCHEWSDFRSHMN